MLIWYMFYLSTVPHIKAEPLSGLIDDEDIKLSLSTLVDNEQLALKAIDGFLLILSDNGEITFVSPNISEFLGLAQVGALQ